MWGCFNWFGLGELVEIHGNLNADQFTDILRNNLMLSAHLMGLGDSFLFQQDNDPKHTSKLAKEFFLSNKINLMKWPSQSPDLNPIEHLWDEIDCRVKNEFRQNITMFRQEMLRVWEKLKQEPEVYRKLIENIRRRLTAVVEKKGKSTRY